MCELFIMLRSQVRCGGSFGRRRYYLTATVVELTELFIHKFFTLTLWHVVEKLRQQDQRLQ